MSHPGARAPERSPDERDPGSQKLMVQQDSGLAQELFLRLFIPDPLVSQGRSRLVNPYTPPHSFLAERCTINLEERSRGEMQYSYSRPAAVELKADRTAAAEKIREQPNGGLKFQSTGSVPSFTHLYV